MTVRYVDNPAGYREFLHSSGLAANIQGRVDAVAANAKTNAVRESGAYAESITAIVEDHPSRVVGHVSSDLPYAAAIEARTGNFARALDAAAG